MSDVAWRLSLYVVQARTFLYRRLRRRNRTRPVLPSSNRLVVKTFLVKLLFLLDLEAAKQPNPRRRVSELDVRPRASLPDEVGVEARIAAEAVEDLELDRRR